MVVDQVPALHPSALAPDARFLWEWNLDRGTLRSVGEWDAAAASCSSLTSIGIGSMYLECRENPRGRK